MDMELYRQGQTVFIGMKMQAELLTALVEEGVLSHRAARPLYGNLKFLTGVWGKNFPDGVTMLSETFTQLEVLLGITEDSVAGG